MLPNQPMPMPMPPQGGSQQPVQPQMPPQAVTQPPMRPMPPQGVPSPSQPMQNAPTQQQLMLAQALQQAGAQQAAAQAQPHAGVPPVADAAGNKFDPSKDSKGNVTVKAVNATGTEAAKSTVSPSGNKQTTQEILASPAAAALGKALLTKTTKEVKPLKH